MRLKNGLNSSITDINFDKLSDPLINWQNKPAIISKSVLLEKRRADNLNEL